MLFFIKAWKVKAMQCIRLDRPKYILYSLGPDFVNNKIIINDIYNSRQKEQI